MLTVGVLGPVRVERDGEALTIPGGKTAELLVRLALDAGVVVRTDRLIEELWGDDAVITNRNTLQAKVARLRKGLGDPALVAGRDGGYVLELDPDLVDAHRVARDAADTAALLEAGDAAAAAGLASAALDRYVGGEVLPSIADEWVEPHRSRLEATRLGLTTTLFTARLQLGTSAELIRDLEDAVADHPFQEDLWALLITALYRAGRQADALAAYQRVRTTLADELGLEPGPALQDLERQILDHDPALGTTTAAAVTSNLPAVSPELVGRDDDLARIRDRIAGHPLVTITGPGGVGKTVVAIEVGRGLAATGVWLVRLDAAATADQVTDAVVAAVGVTGGETALIERLRIGTPVLVLDNCEHVVDDVATFVQRLLDAAGGLRILATSQVPLGIDGEVVDELAPLPLDAAADLFGRRAQTQGRAVRPDAGAEVEELCRSLDGLPLAIELAAARTKTLSIADITRRLDDRFAVLSDPNSRRPERRRALRSTIAWSYDLLFPDDQRGLWALATFAGGASLDAAEHVLAALDVPRAAALDVVSRLAARSLLVVDETDAFDRTGAPRRRPGSAGASDAREDHSGDDARPSVHDRVTTPVRYRLLDSIRAYAIEAAQEAERADDARKAHADWFAAAAATSTPGSRSADQAAHLDIVRTERANIDAALAWSVGADPAQALAMARGFGWPWIVLGDSRGAERLLTALAAAPADTSQADRADALLLAAWIEASTGELEHARAHVDEATALADHLDDVELQARAAYYLAYVLSHEGHWRPALQQTNRAASLLDQIDRPWDQAANALFAARAAIGAGDEALSVQECANVERWLALVEDPWLHVRGEAVLGELARVQRRFDDAVHHLSRAASTSERLGFRQTGAYQLSSLGRAQCQAGDYESGVATLAESVRRAEATGDVRLAALIRVHLGRTRRAVGDVDGAREALVAAADWHERVGGGEQAALGECLLAALDGDGPRLEALLVEARARDDAPVEVFALDALARLAAEAGDADRASELLAAADARMPAASHFIAAQDRVDAGLLRNSPS